MYVCIYAILIYAHIYIHMLCAEGQGSFYKVRLYTYTYIFVGNLYVYVTGVQNEDVVAVRKEDNVAFRNKSNNVLLVNKKDV